MAAVSHEGELLSDDCIVKERKLQDNEKVELIKDYMKLPILWKNNDKSPRKAAGRNEEVNKLAKKHGLNLLNLLYLLLLEFFLEFTR